MLTCKHPTYIYSQDILLFKTRKSDKTNYRLIVRFSHLLLNYQSLFFVLSLLNFSLSKVWVAISVTMCRMYQEIHTVKLTLCTPINVHHHWWQIMDMTVESTPNSIKHTVHIFDAILWFNITYDIPSLIFFE